MYKGRAMTNGAEPGRTSYVGLFVILYLYPVAWGPKGHGSGFPLPLADSGGFYTF